MAYYTWRIYQIFSGIYSEKWSMGKAVEGVCRVCGKYGKLTVEHIIPRAAGGGEKTKIYTGDELIKAVSRRKGDEEYEKPYGKIKQNGYAEYTLCKSCNSYAGKHYDKEFSELYNAIGYFVSLQANDKDRPAGQTLDEYLADKGMIVRLTKLKPHNIAKRVLTAFCSVEHEGLTDRNIEIRKAIMDNKYRPDTSNFSIYFTPHIGSNGYFGTLAALSNDGAVHVYAGIEIGPIAFYLASHDAHLKGGPLSRCIDVTNWLTDYEFDEEGGSLEIHANFENSLALNIPAWAFE